MVVSTCDACLKVLPISDLKPIEDGSLLELPHPHIVDAFLEFAELPPLGSSH